MASAAKELRYRNEYPVSDSLAREFDWDLRERELRHAGEAPYRQEEAQPARRTAQKVHTAAHVQVRERQQVSYLTIAGVAAVLGLAVLVIMSYVQLTVLSADTVALKKELSTLQTENLRLTTEYERMFDLATVKEAAEAAGMVKPGSSQICYIDLSEGDSAVIYRQEDSSVLTRVLTSLNHGVYAVVEYFN